MEKLAPFPERNRERLVHVHAANRVVHQPTRRGCGLRRRRSAYGWRRIGRNITKQPADKATEQPNAPGHKQQPE